MATTITYPIGRKPKVFTASQVGCVLDGITDDAPIINSIIAQASGSNPIKFIIDGVAGISRIQLPLLGFITIEGLGWGTGFNTINGSPNSSMINTTYEVSNNSVGTTSPARSASNYVLRDFRLQGNSTGTGGTTSGIIYGAISISDATDILIDNVQIAQHSGSSIRLSNVNSVTVTNTYMWCSNTGGDGVHVDGPAEDIFINKLLSVLPDDQIALNACEGFGGNIQRVTISDCVFGGVANQGYESSGWCWNGIRAYTSYLGTETIQINQLLISNIVCYCQSQFIKFGPDPGITSTYAEALRDISIENITCISNAGAFAIIMDVFQNLKFINCSFTPVSATTPFLVQNPTSATSGSLLIDGFQLSRSAAGNAAPASIINMGNSVSPGSTVTKLDLRNISVVDTGGSSYAAVANLLDIVASGGGATATTIKSLILEGIEIAHLSGLCNNFPQITALAGGGVLGIGFPVPDAQMANNTLYVSATSGVPSIKVAGVPHAL